MGIPDELTCPICTDLFVEPHIICKNQHTLCGDCVLDLLEHGDVRCPECRDIMDIERNRLACSAVNSIAAVLLTEEELAEHTRRKAKLESGGPDLKCVLRCQLAGTVDEDSSSSVSSSELEDYSENSESESLSSWSGPQMRMRPRRVVDVAGAQAVLSMASGDDQTQLNALREVQRRREAEVEHRLAAERADQAREEACRWNRTRWGQRPGLDAPGEEQRRREQGVAERNQQANPWRHNPGYVRPVAYGSDVLAAALRSAVGSNEPHDDAVEKQRKREAEIEAKQIAREMNDKDKREDMSAAARWNRANWSQPAGTGPAQAGIEPYGKRASGAFKTVLCRHHATGHCRKGSNCGFAHGAAELRGICGRDGTNDMTK